MRIVFRVDTSNSEPVDKLALVRQWVEQSTLPFARAKTSAGQPRVSYGPSASKNQRVEREYADIYLLRAQPVACVRACLAAHAPQGTVLLSVGRVPYALPSVQSLAVAAMYRVEGSFSQWVKAGSFENFSQATQGNLALPGLNLTAFVRDAQTVNDQTVRFTLLCANGKWLNPLQVIYAWLGLEDVSPTQTEDRFTVIREGLLWQDSQQTLHLI